MEQGLDIIRKLYFSKQFRYIYLYGGNAVNFYISNDKLTKDIISDFDINIYTNGNYDKNECDNVFNKIKNILKDYNIKLIKDQQSIKQVTINNIEFDFFINECEPENYTIINDVPIIVRNDAICLMNSMIKNLQEDLDYGEDEYLRKKLNRYMERKSSLEL